MTTLSRMTQNTSINEQKKKREWLHTFFWLISYCGVFQLHLWFQWRTCLVSFLQVADSDLKNWFLLARFSAGWGTNAVENVFSHTTGRMGSTASGVFRSNDLSESNLSVVASAWHGSQLCVRSTVLWTWSEFVGLDPLSHLIAGDAIGINTVDGQWIGPFCKVLVFCPLTATLVWI